MKKFALMVGLFGIILTLSGCIPTATVVGVSNPPEEFVYSPGFNPQQAAYPDVPLDADPWQ